MGFFILFFFVNCENLFIFELLLTKKQNDMNAFLLIYVIVISTIYLLAITSKFGVLKSISASYYKIRHLALFTFFIWSVSIPLMIVGNTLLMFLAGAVLAFVGATPAFRKELEGKVHVVGATGGIILGFASMWIDFGLWWLTCIMAAFTLFAVIKKIKNYTWWIEVAAIVFIVLGLFISRVF